MLPGPVGHFGGVWNAAGGDNLHLSERRRAQKMRCLQVLDEDARVLRPLSPVGSDVPLQTGHQRLLETTIMSRLRPSQRNQLRT